ncbi:MAG: hypothetical protein EOO88_23875 [Pedobacter sp.]|nr:MAG: hypothetical protein EOO88_23875 [Pedobacter sp.]
MNIRVGAIVVCCFLMVSCVSLKTPKRTDLVKLNVPAKIGHYPVRIERVIKENGKTLNHTTVIWYHFKNSGGPDSSELKQATHIALELIDDKHLKAGLYNGDVLLKSNVLKGKLKNGYFRRKAMTEFMGVPPIYWSVTSTKMQLGVGPNEVLYIDHATETNGGILIMMAGTPGSTHSLAIPALK